MNYTPPKHVLEYLKQKQEESGLSFQTIITMLVTEHLLTTPQSTQSGRETNGTETEDVFTN